MTSADPLVMRAEPLHCVVIGPNEPPVAELEREVLTFGAQSPAYRDLRLSFVHWHDRPVSYAELLGLTENEARARRGLSPLARPYHWGDLPNLGVACLVSHLRARGLVAAPINNFRRDRARLDALLDRGPTCVAVTTTFYVSNAPAVEIVQAVRRRRPGVPIVLGGPLIANLARRFPGATLRIALEQLGADYYIVESQGEETLARLVAALARGAAIDDIPNLVFLRDDKLVRTAVEAEANDLDAERLDWQDLAEPGDAVTLQLRTARSCAFKCSFCAYPLRAGALTLASLDTVRRHLDAARAAGAENLVFIDDTFNVPLPRFKQLCRLLAEYPFRWYSYFRAANSDAEAADRMAESGCAGVFLGIESGASAVLQVMNKAASTERYLRGIAQLRERGIAMFGSFIFGFPGETAATVRETIDFIGEARLDWYRIQPWYCEPGTPIMARAAEFGLTGSAFRWRHRTMTAGEAMDHVEAAFREIRGSRWLPQWAFDFWILPYLEGRGVPARALGPWLDAANALLAAELRGAPAPEQAAHRDALVAAAAAWLPPPGDPA